MKAITGVAAPSRVGARRVLAGGRSAGGLRPAASGAAGSPVSWGLPARSRNRIRELAEPKKAAYANDPRLVWGNQETIWPLSRRAAAARLSPRIVALAKPKQDFGNHQCRSLFLYSCGRESTIWERPLLEDFGFPSDRLLKLSEPKKYQAAYLQQRPLQSPEWPVSPAALSYRASPRILELARPTGLHPEFLLPREVPTRVANIAALARAPSRLQRLAEPRVRKVTCCYEHSFPEAVIRPVSKLALEAVASPRTLELARAKRLHPDFVPLRDAKWPVTRAAKHTVATPRLVELAQPCKRCLMDSALFNPDAFTVKETALKATCSARIQDLARPVKR
ncbi:sperm microtubule associated protein 2-like isoform X1 [Opisthocomus hoazin]|uniref:sperm microtubule associated protein 2-like isoform X1 n=1 Tax=Opisthocomus hoazin TaxID=30419 RepID=UPI003F53A0D0